jgi:hypothetical protein
MPIIDEIISEFETLPLASRAADVRYAPKPAVAETYNSRNAKSIVCSSTLRVNPHGALDAAAAGGGRIPPFWRYFRSPSERRGWVAIKTAICSALDRDSTDCCRRLPAGHANDEANDTNRAVWLVNARRRVFRKLNPGDRVLVVSLRGPISRAPPTSCAAGPDPATVVTCQPPRP